MILAIFRVNHSFSVKPFWECTHKHTQRCVPIMILNLFNVITKIHQYWEDFNTGILMGSNIQLIHDILFQFLKIMSIASKIYSFCPCSFESLTSFQDQLKYLKCHWAYLFSCQFDTSQGHLEAGNFSWENAIVRLSWEQVSRSFSWLIAVGEPSALRAVPWVGRPELYKNAGWESHGEQASQLCSCCGFSFSSCLQFPDDVLTITYKMNTLFPAAVTNSLYKYREREGRSLFWVMGSGVEVHRWLSGLWQGRAWWEEAAHLMKPESQMETEETGEKPSLLLRILSEPTSSSNILLLSCIV